MVCRKFEEVGLLYLSNELDKDETESFKSHLSECEECRLETESYEKERALFYAADILEEMPSERVGSAILAACAGKAPAKKAHAQIFMPMLFIKKYAPVPLFLMLVMVAVGGYIKHHSMGAKDLHAQLADEMSQEFVASATVTDTDVDMVAANDDSLKPAIPRTLGNLDSPGVVTVSGQNGQ